MAFVRRLGRAYTEPVAVWDIVPVRVAHLSVRCDIYFGLAVRAPCSNFAAPVSAVDRHTHIFTLPRNRLGLNSPECCVVFVFLFV